jgi:hypothetical protein
MTAQPDRLARAVDAYRDAAGVRAGALDVRAVLADAQRAASEESAAMAAAARAALPHVPLPQARSGARSRRTCELAVALLAARAEGRLTEADQLRLTTHARRCGRCSRLLAAATAGEAAFRCALAGAPDAEPEPDPVPAASPPVSPWAPPERAPAGAVSAAEASRRWLPAQLADRRAAPPAAHARRDVWTPAPGAPVRVAAGRIPRRGVLRLRLSRRRPPTAASRG